MSRPGGQADVDRRAGGRGLREALLLEVRVVDLVHLGEVVDVGEVDADHHHVVPARAALLRIALTLARVWRVCSRRVGTGGRGGLALDGGQEADLAGDLEDVALLHAVGELRGRGGVGAGVSAVFSVMAGSGFCAGSAC